MPTQGGDEQRKKFHRDYEATLARYRALFGEAPPADIWPNAQQRFDGAGGYRRVNLRTSVILPRLKLANAALAMTAISLAACMPDLGERGWKALGVLALGAIALFLLKRGGGGRSCTSSCGGCGGS